jgi:hypothetical protein
MADNVPITAGSGTNIATDEVTGTGEHVQVFKAAVSADGSRTLIPADATNGLLADVSRIQAQLPAGSNTIGFVGITDGSNSLVVDTAHNDGESNTENHLDVSAKLMGFNGTSWDRLRSSTINGLQVDVTSLPTSINLIGSVRVQNGDSQTLGAFIPGDNSANPSGFVLGASSFQLEWDATASQWARKRNGSNVNKTAQYTSTQTGVALWTPGSGRKIYVTALQIQVGGTTAGNVQVWFGGSADTTYTRGTDAALFDGEFAPSATNKPGIFVTFPQPLQGAANFVLRVTTTGPLNPITVSAWGYEI